MRPGLLGRQLRPAALPAPGTPQPLERTVWLAALRRRLYVGAIVFNGISEYFFWNEFGVRYNFIAVDYLVYTNEVVGNIMESYPVVPMTLGIVVADRCSSRGTSSAATSVQAEYLKGPGGGKPSIAPAYVAALFAAIGLSELQHPLPGQRTTSTSTNCKPTGSTSSTTPSSRTPSTTNNSTSRVPKTEAEAFVHGVYGSTGDNLHAVSAGRGSEIRRNIVLVTIESMSASYMERFGNTDVDHAGPRLALPAGHGLRPRLRHGQPHGARTGGRDAVAAALPRAEHHQTSPNNAGHALHGSPAA